VTVAVAEEDFHATSIETFCCASSSTFTKPICWKQVIDETVGESSHIGP
jgi:hypothetical protein